MDRNEVISIHLIYRIIQRDLRVIHDMLEVPANDNPTRVHRRQSHMKSVIFPFWGENLLRDIPFLKFDCLRRNRYQNAVSAEDFIEQILNHFRSIGNLLLDRRRDDQFESLLSDRFEKGQTGAFEFFIKSSSKHGSIRIHPNRFHAHPFSNHHFTCSRKDWISQFRPTRPPPERNSLHRGEFLTGMNDASS